MALSIPAGFPSTTELKAAYQAVKTSNGTFPPASDETVTAARVFAYGEIYGRLAKQGYSKAQVDAWDRLPEFGRDLGLWKISKERVVFPQGNYPPEDHVIHWDRRAELDEILLTIDGEIVEPEGATGAGIVSGRMTTDGDTFVYGETQW